MAPIRPAKLSYRERSLIKLGNAVERRIYSHSHPPIRPLTSKELHWRYSLDDALLHEKQRSQLEQPEKNESDKFLLKDLRVNKRKAKPLSHQSTFQSRSSTLQKNGHLPQSYPVNGVLQSFLRQRVMTNPTTPYHFKKLAHTFALIHNAELKGLFSPFSQKALELRGHLEKIWPRFYTLAPSESVRKTKDFKIEFQSRHSRKIQLKFPVSEHELPEIRNQSELDELVFAARKKLEFIIVKKELKQEPFPPKFLKNKAQADEWLQVAFEASQQEHKDLDTIYRHTEGALTQLNRLLVKMGETPFTKAVSSKYTHSGKTAATLRYEASSAEIKVFKANVIKHYGENEGIYSLARRLGELEAIHVDDRSEKNWGEIEELRKFLEENV